jgi:hypothetical protein
MRKNLALALLAALGLALAIPAAAQKAQKSGEPQSKTAGEKIRGVLPEAQMVFTKEERTLVTNWFRTNRSGLPPGLAKREKLPPGLERQLREKGTLPPGLQKKIQPLPPTLEKQMRILPTGLRRVVVAGNVILMNEKTNAIYDIIRNAIP